MYLLTCHPSQVCFVLDHFAKVAADWRTIPAMGFLKELFEKKLKTAGAYGEDGLEIGRSAQSEWTLPALRPQQGQKASEYVACYPTMLLVYSPHGQLARGMSIQPFWLCWSRLNTVRHLVLSQELISAR